MEANNIMNLLHRVNLLCSEIKQTNKMPMSTFFCILLACNLRTLTTLCARFALLFCILALLRPAGNLDRLSTYCSVSTSTVVNLGVLKF